MISESKLGNERRSWGLSSSWRSSLLGEPTSEELGIDGVNEGILVPAPSGELGISPSILSEELDTSVIVHSARFGELLGIDGVNEGTLLPVLSGELGISSSILSGELGNNGELGVFGGELGIDVRAPLPALSGELGSGWGSPNNWSRQSCSCAIKCLLQSARLVAGCGRTPNREQEHSR